MDSGCTRTCFRQGEPFMKNLKINSEKIKLLCANNQLMDVDGAISIDIDFDSFKVTANPLVVPNLSAPVILGTDVMASLYMDNEWPYAYVNRHKIPLCDQIQPILCRTESYQPLEPYSDNLITIKNPHFNSVIGNSVNAQIHVQPLETQKAVNDITISPGIYKNTEEINLMVTNRSRKRVHLRKNILSAPSN